MNLAEFLPSYLDSYDEMRIDDTQNNLIYGANGIGKSSLYSSLQTNDEYHFIDYDETLRSFIKQKRNVQIATNIVEIEEKRNLINEKRNDQQIKNNLKIFSIGKQGDCIPELLDIFKENSVLERLTTTSEEFEQIKCLNDMLGRDFYSIIKSIIINNTVIDLELEIDALKVSYESKLLKYGNNLLSNETEVCPFCNSEITNLKEQIIERIAALENIENFALSTLADSKFNEQEIQSLVNEVNNISTHCFIDYLVCGGDIENLNRINDLIENISELQDEINQLEEQQLEVYNVLKTYRENIETDIQAKFPNVTIEFSDELNCINIVFPRDIKNYSNGELNYMLFNVKLYEFVGSNKSKLIIDDILTSYDEINQYSLIYLLSRIFNENTDKNFICFTHNFNTLKICKNQDPRLCKMYVLDKINNNLVLFDFNYTDFERCVTFSSGSSFACEYINALNQRRENPTLNKLFHYDAPFEHGGLSNDELICLISELDILEEPIDLGYRGFKSYFEYKVKLFIAFRVYIEKLLYDSVDETLKTELEGKQIGPKICRVYEEHENCSGVTRSDLISKKVMLNDLMHIENRTSMPFSYIFSMKADDIYEEIADLKSKIIVD